MGASGLSLPARSWGKTKNPALVAGFFYDADRLAKVADWSFKSGRKPLEQDFIEVRSTTRVFKGECTEVAVGIELQERVFIEVTCLEDFPLPKFDELPTRAVPRE
jgi:hypothetical protein